MLRAKNGQIKGKENCQTNVKEIVKESEAKSLISVISLKIINWG